MPRVMFGAWLDTCFVLRVGLLFPRKPFKFSLQLRLSMEHHEQVSVKTQSHNESGFCFGLGFTSGAHTHNGAITGILTQVLTVVSPMLNQ